MRPIETERLWIIPCDTHLLEAALRSDEALGEELGVDIPAYWTEFGNGPLEFALDQIKSDPAQNGWWTWLPVHKTERTLIGSAGYKGPPDRRGVVEIGYEIALDFRGHGYATELARGLISHAFENPTVNCVIAHTLPQDNPSTKVLKRCGFDKEGELIDPEDGPVWQWSLLRPAEKAT